MATTAVTPDPKATRSALKPAPTRTTRQRTAKDDASTPATKGGLLAKTTEGLRKVSDKIKEKEQAKQHMAAASIHAGESLQAFLRIRPAPSDAAPHHRPYLELQNEHDVLLRSPFDPSRPHVQKPPLLFSFDRVFSPSVPQISFFSSTTLPLVQSLLQGQNGLMFAYGVSNSGKTYTIAGGRDVADERGVLPRSIDVVFNSIKGLEVQQRLRCRGVADVEICDAQDELCAPLCHNAYEPCSDESVKVDKNFSYAIFVSYAEVYNEKIFDLLESVIPAQDAARPRTLGPGLHRSNSIAFGSTMSLAAMANGGAGVLKRQALTLKNDSDGNGKYISGLKELRVRTRDEALAIFRAGQRARQVFGTLANRESSRSHGIFTIKVVRIHNGDPTHPDSAQVSRLSIVDLAGSERTKNTGTTGDRLKEAGNINKSLMVLGQCMEVMRSNQQKIAAAASAGKHAKKKLDVVPFRHSKLTEVFQNFFVGDGRAVMIINVNPYDTGYDENSHVMRFSAVAREVQVQAGSSTLAARSFPLLRRQISTQFSAFKQAVSGPMRIKVVVPVPAPPPAPASKSHAARPPSAGTVRINEPTRAAEFEAASVAPEYILVEEELEVVEESEESDDGESEGEEEEGKDWLVEYLFEQIKQLKTQLYESEMRNASVEAAVREEVGNEWAELMAKKDARDLQRREELRLGYVEKTDRKIDIFARATTPAVSRVARFEPERSIRESTADSSLPDDSFASATSALTGNEDGEGAAAGDGPAIAAGGRDSDVFLIQPPRKPSPLGATAADSVLDLEAGDVSLESVDVLGQDMSAVSLDPEGNEPNDEESDEEDEAQVEGLAGAEDEESDAETDNDEEDEERQEAAEGLERSRDTGDEEEDLDFEKDANVNGGWHTDSEDAGSVSDDGDMMDSTEDESDEDEEDKESDFEASEEEESEEEVLPVRSAQKGRATGTRKSAVPVSAAKKKQGPAAQDGLESPVSTAHDSPVVPAASRGRRGPTSQSKTKAGATSATKTPATRGKAVIDLTAGSPATPAQRPLREREGNNRLGGSDTDEEDEDESPIVPKSSKKRTLGKKIILEDELEADENRPVRGGGVRRLIPSSARKSGF